MFKKVIPKIKKFTLFKNEMPIGLYNINCNCYMNSVIQCLFHMRKFSDYFIKKNFSKEEQPISSELKNIFTLLKNRNKGKEFGLIKFKKIMGEFDDSFLGSKGADASDLLGYIISALTTEQTSCIRPDISMMSCLDVNEEEKVFNDCQESVGKDTALLSLMNYIKTEYKCFNKSKQKKYLITHRPFYAFENRCYIEFDLEDLYNQGLELKFSNFFNYYFNRKIKSNEFCPDCNKNIDCDSKTVLYKTADYLIIILNHKKNKRFKIEYDENIYIGNFVQSNETKNTKKYFFRLVGAVLYTKNLSSFTHYVACCINKNNEKEEEKTYLFNDTEVKQFNFKQIKSYNLCPYILFYENYFDKNINYNILK